MSPRKITILAMALLPAAGCDWRKFDDLADTAWVKSTGSPAGLNSGEWGVGVAYGGGAGDGVTFIGAGQRPDGVGSIVYDARGAHSGNGILAAATGVTNLDPLPLHPPMAGDPGQGAVILGMSVGSDSGGQVIVFDTDGPGLLTSYAFGAAGIDALAVGAVDNPQQAAGTIDLIAVNQNQLTVVGNYIAPASTDRSQDTCTLGRERGYAAAVGELDTATAESEIAVGMGNLNQDGAGGDVSIIRGSTVTAATGAACDPALVLIDAPGEEPSFGDQIVIADLDGSGVMDLAVSAPGANRVYVWLDVDLAAAPPAAPDATIDGPTGSGRFGEAMAAGDFDADGAAELVIGDGAATVDGTTNAGRAWIVMADGGFTTMHELGDAQPEAEQRFGRAVAVGQFGGTTDVIAVAAHNEVFTYFRTPLSTDDVRD